MNKRIRTTVLTLLAIVSSASYGEYKSPTAEENLRLHFDFSQVQGTEVEDVVGGIKAKLVGVAKVEPVGPYYVLNLGNGTGYLNMTNAAGAVVRSLSDFTVSACYRVNGDASLSGNGYFLWAFSTSSACTQTEGRYMAYRLNAQRMATSTGGWGSESGIETGTSSAKGCWQHVLYRQSGTRGELFINGKRAGQNTNMPVLSTAFTSTPANCWIGRPPFTGDSYLKQTLVADFRVYDVAVDDEQVLHLAAVAEELDQAFNYGTTGDFTALKAKVEECRAFVSAAKSDYAPNAIAELVDVITIAEREIASGRASQVLIDQYVTTLTQLLNTARATQGYQPKQVFPVTGDHGFVHPGGIVSQQDIDRAKQLLADGDNRIKRAWDILCANEYSNSNVATWPTPTVIRGGGSGQNYMNCARGAAMAYQNALRWKIGGTRANADAAVRIMMQWARECNGLGGDTNISLAAGIYGYEWANAAELMRDYDGWSQEDFDAFRQWMIRVFYNPAIDFLRRRHDTWLNWRYPNMGERPGHYWSNWGLCNALCVMSIGILCDDVHMYNQGVSFYKYDHQGTFQTDRSQLSQIVDDGCNEFIGNLVPIVMPDDRGPFGFLGQMQESGRDQGHALMALGLALDICQVGLTQGDDLFAYMDDRIAAGLEHVAALNFGGVAASSLPWKNYNYSDCRGYLGAGWLMTGPNESGKGEYRPYWDRAIGYYEGLRGVKLQYAEKASAAVCPDGGGGNYSQNSGGFDHVGFSTLTSWRPAITPEAAITPLHGDIIYNGVTYENQTNLGGLKYKYEVCPSKGIPADGADIRLIPQLPDGAEDTGNWLWNTGATTRELTVKADRSYIYRVTYTAANGAQSQQAFSIAVSGDAKPDEMSSEITVDGTVSLDTEKTVLSGTSVILRAQPTTGWTDDYLWDNGQRTSAVTIPHLTNSRTYTCQYANQSGAVSESRFVLNVVEALQYIAIGSGESQTNEVQVLPGTTVTLKLVIPTTGHADDVIWSDGTTGLTCTVNSVSRDQTVTATYLGMDYTYYIYVKATDYSYYSLLTTDRGYRLVTSADELSSLADDCYFVLASDQADLLIGLRDAPKNGNKALFFQSPADPLGNLSAVFSIETYDGAFCLRNIDYDGLLLQTEWDRPDQLRTHDQPLPCEWSRLLMVYADGSWTVENGRYPGNWLGLWTPANGYRDGEEIACNKTGDDIAHLQIFAIDRNRFHTDYLTSAVGGSQSPTIPADATPLLVNPQFVGNGFGWTMSGSWGNQRYNGAVEVWHSNNFAFTQTLSGLPNGHYTVACQLVNGEGQNTSYLFASSGSDTQTAVVSQSCAGSNFDVQRDRMAASATYGRLAVDIDVADGSLTLGIREPSAGNTWLVWDNFTLTYNGSSLSAIRTVTDNSALTPARSAIYDLTGRHMATSHLKKGIYIVNGKKVVR